ncbi:hypothetical protein G7Y89_g10178 [Cudoniella acicularis]|uniref:Uncharacterized protein n=1 Tax=Cudoniella acicularis TaxID=354080 RepID=A0A8H4VZ02_9HELO|nr:hypothetical protein G7Y89_g10178 [Cudoniella acicularis]
MLRTGTNVHRTITVASDLHSAGSSGHLEVSAFDVIHSLMNKVWSVKNASINSPIDEDDLAEKACSIKNLMTSMNAKMRIQIYSPLPQRSKKPKNSKQARRAHTMQGKAKGPPPIAIIDKPKTMLLNDPVYSNLGTESSPWAHCKLRKEASQLGQEIAEPVVPKGMKEFQLQKRWGIREQDNQINLLNHEEQELAEKLSCPLSGKEKLLVFREMSRLPYQRQEQILECSKVLQQWRETMSTKYR